MTLIFTIDNGNSNPNVGVFKNGVLDKVWLKDAFLAQHKALPPNAAAILADVGRPNQLHDFFGPALIRLKAFRGNNAFLDMPVHYALTLGEDRLALAYHVYKTMPALPALVVDSGTFTTIDVVTPEGFMGGYIFPGVRRFYEIYGQSARLPDLSAADFEFKDEPQALPQTTDHAILKAGQIYWRGVFKEIKAAAKQNFGLIALTGGDALKLKPLLAGVFNGVNIHADEKLIHKSLYTVYVNG